MSRLFKALSLELSEPLRIRSDNKQTLRLFDESVKLATKLRHVDIHNHSDRNVKMELYSCNGNRQAP